MNIKDKYSDKIISGKELSKTIKNELFNKISILDKKPCLAVIIVGNDPASEIYVKNKEKACEQCGIKSLKYEFKENISEIELLNTIEQLNKDENINGILVQLPLPKHINENNVINSINPIKDVDCFSPINIGKLFIGNYDFDKDLLPCTPKGCVKLIKTKVENLSGKKVCVLGRSNIVGKPIAQMLLKENATVKIVHSKTIDIELETSWADILIVAIGKANFIKSNMIKKDSIIIDVGINRDNGTIVGDVDFNNVIDKVKYITPVPGGVGPMTIACLMENVYNAYLNQSLK